MGSLSETKSLNLNVVSVLDDNGRQNLRYSQCSAGFLLTSVNLQGKMDKSRSFSMQRILAVSISSILLCHCIKICLTVRFFLYKFSFSKLENHFMLSSTIILAVNMSFRCMLSSICVPIIMTLDYSLHS